MLRLSTTQRHSHFGLIAANVKLCHVIMLKNVRDNECDCFGSCCVLVDRFGWPDIVQSNEIISGKWINSMETSNIFTVAPNWNEHNWFWKWTELRLKHFRFTNQITCTDTYSSQVSLFSTYRPQMNIEQTDERREKKRKSNDALQYWPEIITIKTDYRMMIVDCRCCVA